MFTREDILAYRCPRWNDWPNLDLYMDQAISLIETHVQLFYADGQPKPVTSTMINNYVKQKIVPPSRKKKYGRDHLAYFYIIFLLKSALNLVDISEAIAFFHRRSFTVDTFHTFCNEIETALAIAFSETPNGVDAVNNVPATNNPAINAPAANHPSNPSAAKPDGIEIIRGFALAFAYTLQARFYVQAGRGENETLAKR